MYDTLIEVIFTTLMILPPALFVICTVLCIIFWIRYKKKNSKLWPAVMFTILAGYNMISLLIEGGIIWYFSMVISHM